MLSVGGGGVCGFGSFSHHESSITPGKLDRMLIVIAVTL